MNGSRIILAAHRGDRFNYPENTMLAYRKAAELGVDQIEIDIRITKDGELVIIHDATVDRTTNGTGKVKDFTLAQLKESSREQSLAAPRRGFGYMGGNRNAAN